MSPKGKISTMIKSATIKSHIAVLVLGDVGRSPRMSYHALSLAQEGFQVTLIGYRGSQPHDAIINNDKISLQYLPNTPNIIWIRPKLIQYILKVLMQSLILCYCLVVKVPKPTHILVQNPPTIPTFYVGLFVCVLRGAEFIIDWHNFGYTILSLTLGNNHPFVKINKWVERVLGRMASKSLCVSRAMHEFLEREWRIENCALLYDTPGQRFRCLTLEDKHELFDEYAQRFPPFRDLNRAGNAFTELMADGKVRYRQGRPALIISSTSWTEDEDFSILLSTLELYNERKRSEDGRSLPRLICCITGKGPLKEYYRQQIELKNLAHVDILLPWLPAEEYPKLLGAADLGVCLHTSSSGLDLPMKVVDMFGCQLPVCAINYNCIGELVKHEENGLIFNTHNELLTHMVSLLESFPANQAHLLKYRQHIKTHFQKNNWHKNWAKNALPLFR